MDILAPAPLCAPAPLAHPQWGLAWSNPRASKEALIRNAFARGASMLILDACIEYGIEWVRAQWDDLCATDEAPSAEWQSYVGRALDNIERGLVDAQA